MGYSYINNDEKQKLGVIGTIYAGLMIAIIGYIGIQKFNSLEQQAAIEAQRLQVSGTVKSVESFEIKKSMWDQYKLLENIASNPKNPKWMISQLREIAEYNRDNNPDPQIRKTVMYDKEKDGIPMDLTFKGKQYLRVAQKDTAFFVDMEVQDGFVLDPMTGEKTGKTPVEYAKEQAKQAGVYNVFVNEPAIPEELKEDENTQENIGLEGQVNSASKDYVSLVGSNALSGDNGIQYSKKMLTPEMEEKIAKIYSTEKFKKNRVAKARQELNMNISHSSIYRVAKQYQNRANSLEEIIA